MMGRILSLLSALALGAGALGQVPEVTWQEDRTEAPAPEALPPEADPELAQTQSMSLRARVAQLMLVTLGGRGGARADDRLFLEQCPPGGVVIPVLRRPGDAAAYRSDLRAFELASGIPLWVGANIATLWRGDRTVPSEFQ